MGSTTIVRSLPAHGMPPEGPPAEAVLEQLGRILASPLFRSSKHYPRLLKHVVEQTLAGNTANLKERSLGMQVFGRDPHYDTNADPVVRTSACEVRKRIAQYYHEPERGHEIRIELPAGCYVPEFRFPETRVVEAAPEPTAVASAPERSFLARHVVAAAITAGVLVLAAAAALASSGMRRAKSAEELFWEPVWQNSDSVLVCLGIYQNPPAADPVEQTPRPVMWNDRVAFTDAVTMAKLVGLAQAHGKQVDIRASSTLTLEDLHKKPPVLIGAFTNPWTIALTEKLRYSFGPDPATRRPVIRDTQNPSGMTWSLDNQRASSVSEDYAIVSRYVDRQLERMVVAVAGLGKDGTAAAGEFVADSRYLETLASRAPRDWSRKNLQVVLATEIINGNAGPPRVLATYFW